MNKPQLLILTGYLIVIGFDFWLEFLNLRHLRRYGLTIPPEFEGEVDKDLLKRTMDYTIENTRFGIITSVINNIILLIFIFGGLLNIYNSWVMSQNLPFIPSGVIFFILLFYAETLLSVPFSLYRTFRIEKKYGFSTMTPKLWITDLIKTILISSILLIILITIGLYIIKKSPEHWWLWLWSFLLLFGIFIMYLSPYVIEPLFHKFTPIDKKELEVRIHEIMNKARIKVSRIFKMDASRRTRHTNAYFTGIGKVKRIVLFDTLLERMNDDEIISVLAHEVGHWRKRHLLKHIIFTESMALIALYASYHILKGNILLEIFHIEDASFFANITILTFIGSIISFPLTPLLNHISRRHEIEADRYSYELTGDADAMATALVKLSKDNLSNLYPHPFYAFFHYSHPPVLERIRWLREGKTTGG